MHASTLTRKLRPLQEAGWIEVQAGEDGRSLQVRLTAAGRAKRAEAQRHWRAAQEALNQDLGLEHVRALHAMVDQTLAALGAAPLSPARP